ncbi:MAG: stage III sporulation protein AB [Clostridia bacterium]|nr:stage III sporulation protein AB [Clostridia bacterium]
MLKTMGAVLVLLCSGAVGFGFARDIHAQIQQLTALITALENLKGEIESRRTPLPAALMMLAGSENPQIGSFFKLCAENLSVENCSSPYLSIRYALDSCRGLMLSRQTRLTLLSFGMSLGKIDAQSQLSAASLAASRLEQELNTLRQAAPARAKSYRVIGVCTGLALAVVLI